MKKFFEVSVGSISLFHGTSGTTLSSTTVLLFQIPANENAEILKIPSIKELHKFWVQLNGHLTIKMDISNHDAEHHGSECFLQMLNETELWGDIGFRVSSTQEKSLFGDIELQIQRDISQVQRHNQKCNQICYSISPERIQPPLGIRHIELLSINVTVDIHKDCINDNYSHTSGHLIPSHDIFETSQYFMDEEGEEDGDEDREEDQYEKYDNENDLNAIFSEFLSTTNSPNSSAPLAICDHDHPKNQACTIAHLVNVFLFALFRGIDNLPAHITAVHGICIESAHEHLSAAMPFLFDLRNIYNMSYRYNLLECINSIFSPNFMSRARSKDLKSKFNDASCLSTDFSLAHCDALEHNSIKPLSAKLWDLTAQHTLSNDLSSALSTPASTTRDHLFQDEVYLFSPGPSL